MRQQGEASVEEILDSIKKVIARDNREGAIEERRRRSNAGISGAESVHNAMPEPASDDEAEEILDLSDAQIANEELSETGEEADCEESAPDSPLTGEAMTASVRDNLAALAMMAQPGAQPQIVRSGETSLEGLVRDMLRPMLADWLDTNLPQMVERMVQTEIARIAGKRD